MKHKITPGTTHVFWARELIINMIQNSFLSNEAKLNYQKGYRDKVARLGMTKTMIAEKINSAYPFVYTPTTAPTKLIFLDRSVKVGYCIPVV